MRTLQNKNITIMSVPCDTYFHLQKLLWAPITFSIQLKCTQC